MSRSSVWEPVSYQLPDDSDVHASLRQHGNPIGIAGVRVGWGMTLIALAVELGREFYAQVLQLSLM